MAEPKMKAVLDPINELSEQETNVADTRRRDYSKGPNLAKMNLLEGDRKEYLRIGVPLYEAAIKCDWNAAEDIFKKNKELDLVRYSITENGETALHIAASAKVPGKVKVFVKNLVKLMTLDDLALENANFNTALYLAAAAGNIKTVEIMLDTNPKLLEIRGGGGSVPSLIPPTMMPIYVAALFGNHKVVNYMYGKSNDLKHEHWTPTTLRWLLEKCVENNMFDVALKIVTKYPELETGSVLTVLARKPEAFREPESNFIQRTISWGINLCSKKNVTNQPSQNGDGSVPGILNQEQPSQNGNGSVPGDLNQEQPSQNGDGSVPGDLNQEQPSQNGNGSVPGDLNLEQPSQNGDGSVPGDLNQDQPSQNGNGSVPEDMNLEQPSQDGNGNVTGGLNQEKPSQNGDGSVSGDLILEKSSQMGKGSVPGDLNQDQPFQNGDGSVPGDLDREAECGVIGRTFKSVITYFVSKVVPPKKNDEALQLLKIIWKAIAEKPKNDIDSILRGPAEFKQEGKSTTGNVDQASTSKTQNTKRTYPSRILFVAAKMGNTKFVVELIRLYPDLIWKVDDKKRSIFHIAIKRRHEGIYNLLYEIGAMKDLITPIRDVKGNNMLHLVGKSASKKRRHQDVSGVAFQMQRELLWFKEVEAMIPPSYRERKNNDGRTPYELFTEEHKELVTLGERWMKETANQCMVVAALIATIVFAAAFTVPGGYDQPGGFPIFHSKATFMVFVVADAISLFSSTASILIFLSILTSRYAERDFLVSLPKKLMAGLATLFLSITTMTVAFSVSFFVLYHKGVIWMPILIAVFAVMPVLLYIRLQYALFFDVIRSIYGSTYLFKPRKHVLYYENPKV